MATKILAMPKASGEGIMVDTISPTFAWKDMIGRIVPKASGAGSPSRGVYRGGTIGQFKFVLNDLADTEIHVPHDFLPGSDLFAHVHWSHNGTNISGNVVFTNYLSYAKGHNQALFSAEIAPTITYNTTDITTTPQYRHRIDEIQITNAGGDSTHIDHALIEPDGVLLWTIKVTTLPTITGGDLYIHFVDLHYQSTNIGTKQKAPNFYT